MKKILVLISMCVIFTSCIRDNNVSEDLKQIKTELTELKADVAVIKAERMKADSFELIRTNQKLAEMSDSLKVGTDSTNKTDVIKSENIH